MVDKADSASTPIPRGFGRGHEVTAAGGGRVTVGNQCAKGERQVLWLNPDTGEWREFSELIPRFDPHYFRIPRADSIFETGLWYGRRRQPIRTYKGLDWSKCQSEDVQVVISILSTDKPLVPAPPSLPAPKQNKSTEPTGRQISRAIRAAKIKWPPDGKPPEGMPKETSRGQVNELLADESRRLELAHISPDTWKRALDYLCSQ